MSNVDLAKKLEELQQENVLLKEKYAKSSAKERLFAIMKKEHEKMSHKLKVLHEEKSDIAKEKKVLSEELVKVKNENIALREIKRLFDAIRFGRKSEKKTAIDETQQLLFNEAEDEAFKQKTDEPSVAAKTEQEEVTYTRRKKRGKNITNTLSPNLPQKIVTIDLPKEKRKCACGKEMPIIGHEESKRVELIPARLYVHVEKLVKRACKSCDGIDFEDTEKTAIKTAKGTKRLIPGGIASESLIAWTLSEKFEYALPFYRQEKRFKAIGVNISRATLCNNAILAAKKCRPLIYLIKKHIEEGSLVNADETPVQVLREKGRKASSKSYMWVFKGGEQGKESLLFHYSPNRSSETPTEMLQNFSGWLQTDDYSAYHKTVRVLNEARPPDKKIKHTLCWAHVRRKFTDVLKSGTSPPASHVVNEIGKLFAIENHRTKMFSTEFIEFRKQKATKVFNELETWLKEKNTEVRPECLLGKAINYALSNWSMLINYIDDLQLSPSNNIVENAIRPFAIGRKNWLFNTSVKGADSSAVIYSLIETAKLHKLPGSQYLHYIFAKIPYVEDEKGYEALLPWNISQQMLCDFYEKENQIFKNAEFKYS